MCGVNLNYSVRNLQLRFVWKADSKVWYPHVQVRLRCFHTKEGRWRQLICMSFWCFNAAGRELSHNTSLTSEKSSLRKYNISKSTDLPRCLGHAASLSLWPCVCLKEKLAGETELKERKKPTYRYFQTTGSCPNDFLRVYEDFRLPCVKLRPPVATLGGALNTFSTWP